VTHAPAKRYAYYPDAAGICREKPADRAISRQFPSTFFRFGAAQPVQRCYLPSGEARGWTRIALCGAGEPRGRSPLLCAEKSMPSTLIGIVEAKRHGKRSGKLPLGPPTSPRLAGPDRR